MATLKFSREIKTRLPADTRRRLEAMAKERQVSVADIVREALREFIERQQKQAA